MDIRSQVLLGLVTHLPLYSSSENGSQAETFSGQAVVKPRLQDPNALTDLENLMNLVLRRRAEKTEALP